MVTPWALRSAVTKTGRRRQCACIHASAASARSAPATLAMRIFLGALIAAQCSTAHARPFDAAVADVYEQCHEVLDVEFFTTMYLREAQADLAREIALRGAVAREQQGAAGVDAGGGARDDFGGQAQGNGLAARGVVLLPFGEKRREARVLKCMQHAHTVREQMRGEGVARGAAPQRRLHVGPGLIDAGASALGHAAVESDADHHVAGAEGFTTHL